MATPSILDCDIFDLANRVLDVYSEAIPFEDFGQYHVLESIGKGGMGEVFLAEDKVAGRPVAIKCFLNVWSESDRRQRFTREVQMLAKLEHPYIARLYDVGVHPNGTPYFVLEYVEGKPLDEYCRARRYSVEERLRLFHSVCEAVQYAHSRLVIHRDLKPSNILVKDDGTPKLLDFGIAKQLENIEEAATQTKTEVRFTRAYAAPEQLRHEPVGVYTDVYALGIILYELLTGKPPYDFETCTPVEAEIIITSDQEAAKPSAVANRGDPSLDPGGRISRAHKAAWNDLDVLCLKAMKKDVRRRYPSVVELAQDIDHYLRDEPLKSRPDTLSYRTGKFMRRNRRTVVGSALALTLIVALIAFFTLRLANARDQANRETAISKAMNQFLSDDLLGQSDPFRSGQARESFVDVVNRASSRIDLQFKAEPLVAARLHQTIGRAFDNRSDFQQARREYARAVDLFRQGEGLLSADAIITGLQQAAMEARSNERGSLTFAQSIVTEAERSISRIDKPREDLVVWLLSTRGVIALIGNDGRSANEDFSTALRRAQAIPSFDEAARRRLKGTLAFSYIRLGDGARAEPLFREIAETYSRTAGPDSPDALRGRVNLSQALLIQRKYRQTIEEANRIYPTLVKKLGEDHEVTMTVLGTRAASEGYLGLWDQAINDDLTVYDLAVRKQGPLSSRSIVALSDASLSQCRAGRYTQGESNARKAFRESSETFGPRAGITGGCSYALATCLIGMNKQLGEASELLKNIDVEAVTQLSGDSSVYASIALARGEIAARTGDYALAQRCVETATPMIDRPNSDLSDRQALARLRNVIDSHLRESR